MNNYENKRHMTPPNCIECENNIMLEYSSLQVDYDTAQERIKLLEDGLRTTRKLCDFYSDRCNELENKVKFYKDMNKNGKIQTST